MVIRCGKLDFLEEYLNSDQKRLGYLISDRSVGREVKKKLLRAFALMCLTRDLSSVNLLQKSSLWLSLNFFRILSFMTFMCNACNTSPLNQGGILFISSILVFT